MNNFKTETNAHASGSSDSSFSGSNTRRPFRSNGEKSTGSITKKKKSSAKERDRNQAIKKRLEEIRHKVPFVEKDLSKIRTLRLASAYISHLKRILSGEVVQCSYTGAVRPLMMDDFKHVVMKEMQVNNTYKERADLEIATATSGFKIDSQETTSPSFYSSTDLSSSPKLSVNLPPMYHYSEHFAFPPDHLSHGYFK